ncbi:DUF502 domain-containing protein [Legionella israelensis]|nr:DUF502 domain-containing protein [Legionella israelensis]
MEKMLMSLNGKISSIFWRGFLTLLPLYLTLYFLIWLLSSIETTFSKPLILFIGEYYFPGLGLFTAFLFILFIGLIMKMYVAQAINKLVNSILNKLPLVGEIYNSIQNLTKYLSSSDKIEGKEAVMVHVESMDLKLIGIVTRKDFEDAPEGIGNAKMVSVYLPMSYQIGGFTVYVPKKSITTINMTQNEALKWVFFGGIKNEEKK